MMLTVKRRLCQWNQVCRLTLWGLAVWSILIPFDPAHAEHAGASVRPEVHPQLASYTPVERLTGRLTVGGSNTMAPLLTRLAGEFMRVYPGVRVMVESEGSEEALAGFVDGLARSRRGDGNLEGHLASSQIKLMASSRKLTPSEIATFVSRHGYEPTELPIATDAVAIYVHKDSHLTGLTLDQVDAIFSQTQKRGWKENVLNWGQVGLNHGEGKTFIRLYGRDRKSGTREFFREHVLLGGEFKDEVEEVPGAASIIYEVARNRFAMGYSSIGFQTPLVKAVPLAEKEGSPYVVPTAETTLNGSYPLARSLFLYVNKSPDQPLDPILLEFLRFANSREAQEAVVGAGAYPIPARRAARNLALLGSATQTVPVAMHK